MLDVLSGMNQGVRAATACSACNTKQIDGQEPAIYIYL